MYNIDKITDIELRNREYNREDFEEIEIDEPYFDEYDRFNLDPNFN